MRQHYDFLSIGPGVQATAGAASGTTAIPDTPSGTRAKRVVIRVVTASETAYVLPCLVGGSVAAGTGLPVAKETPVILDVEGYTHIARLRAGGSDVTINIVPLAE